MFKGLFVSLLVAVGGLRGLPVGPLVARLDAIELTEPLLIDTEECWEWLRADADRALRMLLMDCWLLYGAV